MGSGSIKGGGGMGHSPPVRGSAPICPPPPLEEKMVKTAIYDKFLDFCPLDAPTKKVSDAATAHRNPKSKKYPDRIGWTNDIIPNY